PIVIFKLLTLAALAAWALSRWISPTAGLVALIMVLVFGIRKLWIEGRSSGVILRVRGSQLEILSHRRRRHRASIPLADLRDVILDTKTIRRVQESQSAVPQVRFIETRVGPEIDTARIVLVARSEVRLTEAYLAHMDSVEWLGKIRVFLRKHGWVPEDE